MKKKRVLFISSTGGHLEELMQLRPMFDKYNYYIVTERTKSNLNLKNKTKQNIFYIDTTKYFKGRKILEITGIDRIRPHKMRKTPCGKSCGNCE